MKGLFLLGGLCSLLVSNASAFTPYLFKSEATGICDSVHSEAGYYAVEEDKKYFYWFFESRNDPSNDPVFVWMTGGPGCSSQVALFHENGPCKINDDKVSTTVSESGWNKNANAIYIDQPAGVGFSTGTKDDHTEKNVGDNMVLFLEQFFESHPELKDNEFYIVGESYGGHYVPNVAKAVYDRNQKAADGDFKINIKGLAIGNGLTDPRNQYDQYCNFARNNGYRELTSKANEWMTMTFLWPLCRKLIDKCADTDVEKPAICTKTFQVCTYYYSRCADGLISGNWNTYNVQEKCAVPPLCYDFADVETFVDQPHVRKALGVGNIEWQACDMDVNKHFNGDFMRNYAPVVKELLEADLRVLIYAGDADFICNWMGNDNWTRKLEWTHGEKFANAPLKNWSGDGKEIKGELRQAENFSFLKIHKAGHMVPLDQPGAASLLIDQFFANTLKYDEE